MLFLDFEKPLEDLHNQITKLKEMSAKNKVDVTNSIRELEAAMETTRGNIYANLTPLEIEMILALAVIKTREPYR